MKDNKKTMQFSPMADDANLDVNPPNSVRITGLNGWDTSLALLDALGVGVMLLNCNTVVCKANVHAREILRLNNSLHLDGEGRLKIGTEKPQSLINSSRDLGRNGQKVLGSMQIAQSATEGDPADVNSLTVGIIEIEESRDKNEIKYVAVVQNLKQQAEDLFRYLGTSYDLSKAEVSVLQYAIRGYSNKQIANLRSVSEQTIKAQLKSIFQKTQITSRGELFWLVWSRWLPQIFANHAI